MEKDVDHRRRYNYSAAFVIRLFLSHLEKADQSGSAVYKHGDTCEDSECLTDKARQKQEHKAENEQYRRSGLSDTLRWLLEKDGEWEGTAKALFDNVRAWTGRDPAKNPRMLCTDLKLFTPLMRELEGITYTYIKRGTNKGIHHFSKTS